MTDRFWWKVPGHSLALSSFESILTFSPGDQIPEQRLPPKPLSAEERAELATKALRHARILSTCPEWARVEVAAIVMKNEAEEHWLFHYGNALSPASVEALELVCNPCMTEAWMALDKHQEATGLKVSELILAMNLGLERNDGLSRLERDRIASRVLSNVKALLELTHGRDKFVDWRDIVAAKMARVLRNRFHPLFAGSISAENMPNEHELHLMAGSILGEMLSSLATGALEWSGSPALVPKPNHPKSRRLYFLRTIAHWTKGRFDRPLWGVVLALASIHFDCEDLDADSVRVIASRKRRP